jgi:hypothetical protein
MKPQNWDEAMDQLADDNHLLWNALDNLTTLWESQASDRAIDFSMKAARQVLNQTKPKTEE